MPIRHIVTGLILLFTVGASAATLYVDLNSANPAPPYSDWSTAAPNIQDAIDASTDGDQIWVTNGVYTSGGRVMAGDLTNRVALNKAVTVQSVNGPFATVIQGAGLINGTAAVRCAWLTNSASLIGFTLTRGATRTSGDVPTLESGGGAWCASSNALVQNCVIVSNAAAYYGAGAYQGTVNSCLVSSNGLQFLSSSGGALYNASLNNCSVVSNTCIGTAQCRSTNSIVYYNYPSSGMNYFGGSFSFCCTTPLPSGAGNFTGAPQLFPDGIHLLASSPCIGAGTTPVTSADIFGNSWASPPSVGCTEAADTLLVAQPQVQLTSTPIGFKIGNAAISGLTPFTLQWLKDGVPLQDNAHFSFTQSTNLVATSVSFADAGNYQLIVSNAVGMATSAVAQVIIHCVDAAGANPAPPYTNWTTAATNIQDAITAAATNEIVLVTNGVYATGGKSMDNLITNRVSMDKAILVQSVNGPNVTLIQGAWDPASTNGPAAVRCVWMTNNSILKGFTVCGGATRVVTSAFTLNQSMNGGGIWASSTNAVVDACLLVTNYASNNGGGANSGTLNYCTLAGNHSVGSGMPGAGIANAGSGGGAADSRLKNCLVNGNIAEQSNGGGALRCNSTNCAFINNRAVLYGSAAYQGNLINCTLANNTSGGYGAYGGAAASASLINCIVSGNFNIGSGSTNYTSCTFSYSDTDPLPTGTGNIDVDPQLLRDLIHLGPASPCMGAGTSNSVSGTDIDNQPWNNPPSMGCDEWQPAPVIGIQPVAQAGSPSLRALSFPTLPVGQSPFSCYWFKDGTLIQDNAHYVNSATSNLGVNNFQPDDAGSYQLILSNAFGSVTSQLAQVVIHTVDLSSANPQPPFSSWSTAATNIQDAINAAAGGDIVLVTNGVYATGGKAMVGDLTNRVALDKALTVISVNGYSTTVIEGQWDAISTNGPGAVRCALLDTGAMLNGFTLRNGATRGSGSITLDLQYGGGAWLSTNAVISNCVLTNNRALYAGGGIAFGTVDNSFIHDNTSQIGGGAYSARLNNCTVMRNHCLTGSTGGAGTTFCTVQNSIVINNYLSQFGNLDYQLMNDGSPPSKFLYSCSNPQPAGTGNINVVPQFLDYGFHLAAASPCRGAGSSLYATGSDLDDELFANPPSMGCDEVIDANLIGPLSVLIWNGNGELLVNHPSGFSAIVNGRASGVTWSFGDGTAVTNAISGFSHAWANAGVYTVTFTAYNLDNPSGVSTNITMIIDPVNSPFLQSAGVVSNSFQFSFTAQSNANYYVQYATNLAPPVTWQSLQTIYFSTGGVITIQDPAVTNPTNAVRFYRVQAQ